VTVIAHTGALYALIDASDRWHERIMEWWSRNTQPIVVPVTVLPELCYLLQKRIGPRAENALIRAVADGEFVVEQIDAEDWPGIALLAERHSDLPLGFVDASVAVVAERLDAREILTTDRAHFGVVRSSKGRPFQMEP
jgi:hypothetical protein